MGVPMAVTMVMASLPMRMPVAPQDRHDAQVDDHAHQRQNEHYCTHMESAHQ